MDLRLATEADVPAIVALVNAVSATSVASVAEAPDAVDAWLAAFERDRAQYPWLVATHAGAFAGFAKAAPYGTRDGYLWSTELTIYLTPAARGQGVADALYARLLALLEAQGFRHAWAKITAPNPPSERLHARFGLRCVGVQTAFAWKHGRWHDIGLWQGPIGADTGPPRPLRPVAAVWSTEARPA